MSRDITILLLGYLTRAIAILGIKFLIYPNSSNGKLPKFNVYI